MFLLVMAIVGSAVLVASTRDSLARGRACRDLILRCGRVHAGDTASWVFCREALGMLEYLPAARASQRCIALDKVLSQAPQVGWPRALASVEFP